MDGPLLSIQIPGDILRQLSCFVSWHPAPERRGAGAVARAAEANPTFDSLCLESRVLRGISKKHPKNCVLEAIGDNWCFRLGQESKPFFKPRDWAQRNCSNSHPTVVGGFKDQLERALHHHQRRCRVYGRFVLFHFDRISRFLDIEVG